MRNHLTPSGIMIDVSKCHCGKPATMIIGFYVLVGPIEVPVCDEHKGILDEN